MKERKTQVSVGNGLFLEAKLEEPKDFLEEAEKEKKELEESYKESKRQTKERKTNETWKENK